MGCGFCAINIKPEPEFEEEDIVVDMPEEVIQFGGDMQLMSSINADPSNGYGMQRDSEMD